jgi:hypothetical protein
MGQFVLLAGGVLGLLAPAAVVQAQGISKLAGQDQDLDALVKALKSTKVEERQKALEGLARLGAKAKTAVPDIVAAFKDRNGLVRFLAVQALVRIGPDAVPKLKEALQAADSSTRHYAAATLQQLAKAGPPGNVTSGQLTNNDPFDPVRNGCRHKVHVVAMKAGQTYIIDLKSTDFDAYLRLEGPDGAKLAEDDDSGGDLNARLTFTAPKDGMYRVIATTFQQGQTGDYSLIVGTKVEGKAIAGQLTKQDAFDAIRQGCHHKVHLIPMKAGKTYIIDLKSTAFDSYLRLEGPDGARLAEDDDGGGNLNARISFVAPKDGMYRVIATTFGPGATGDYTLVISEGPG